VPIRARRALATLALALLGLAAVGVATPAHAASPIYTVERVEVDVTSDTATAARQQAIVQGHRKAFDRLLARIVPRERLNRVPQPSAEQLRNFVRDFEVFDERTSDVRYLAELTLRFQPGAVRQYLRGNNVAFAQTRSKPVVVLPVYGSEEEASLWGEPNPWRQAWAERAEQTGLVPLTVPLGDLADINAVGAQQALAGAEQPLSKIAARYDANDVLVTQARVAGDPEAGTASMQVISTRIGTPRLERTLVDNVQQQQDEALEAMLARAADQVARDVEETWKRAHLIRYDQRNTLSVEVPVDGLSRWITVRERLTGAAEVAGLTIDMMTRRTVRLDLAHYGDTEQLQVALEQQDLTLERAETESDARGAAADPAGPAWRIRAAEMAADAGSARDGGGTRDSGGVQVRDLERGGSGRAGSDSGDADADATVQ
jgi:hypothetical protein